ncbi:hypothetical protein EPUS_02275 [Endocarpon pusillum Z07020]|uniref:F-box domain-containing protein n=1 Tax=Endocarpon pusillum (strain Z07020 / HMAS-L-300199) TaxID=1263415 RepID=U1GX96_ENDPU|nr:uncharacterized protein EPUS_02275 [Endocarpon pusillum Z07020]ERF76736.1 hypothetical protein EPUS_02275 [Endocarpon pusillum Z07020]
MPCSIHSLPNEILIQILAPFPVRSLLSIAPTSPRFSSLILRILHYRLLLAASLGSHKLILEAYHPIRKYSEPYLFCTYLSTPGLSSAHEGEGSLYENTTVGGRFSKLNQLYSCFRPERPGVEGNVPKRPYLAGGTGSQADSSSASQPIFTDNGDGGNQKIEHIINLDSHELFSQFCTIANLVTIGPRRGVFLSVVNVEDKVMRVWREWLEERARASREEEKRQSKNKQRREAATEATNFDTTVEETELQEQKHEQARDIGSSPSILWTDHNRNVGLLVTIKDRKWRAGPGPLLVSADEEQPASYSIEIKELVVRTTHLMLAVEETQGQQTNISGKAMIFGSFARAADATTA